MDRMARTRNELSIQLISIKKKIYNNKKTLGDLKKDFGMLNNCNKTILVTSHRRENFGEGITELCSSLSRIVKKNKDLQVIFPVHLNSAISEPVNRICGNTERIYLLPPQDYLRFTYLMDNCDLIFTDSGGIQEEAISLKKTVFLLRENTERPEALTTGLVKLVGTSYEKIDETLNNFLNNKKNNSNVFKISNPYGDGFASDKIKSFLEKMCDDG